MKPFFLKGILALFALAAAAPAWAMGGFGVTDLPVYDFAVWASTPGAQKLVGDFNGDGMTDIALTGAPTWTSVPVAFSNGDGSFTITNTPIGLFGSWAATAGAKPLVGDFNHDGKADIALTAAPSFGSVPVAFSNGDGSFYVTNLSSTFASWAKLSGAQFFVADYNADGKADIAVGGPIGLPVIPVAFSNGDGSFDVTSATVWLTPFGATTLSGDFNDDGKADLALTGISSWASIPVAFSNGDGTFDVTNAHVSNFPTWAAEPGVKIVAGDFNGDGRADIGLTGGATWASVPLAFSNGDGSFDVTNVAVPGFPANSRVAGVTIVAGDFNADGNTDLAATGGATWASVPVIFSRGDGTFFYTNQPILGFGPWAAITAPLPGDYNDDDRMDLALTGVPGWTTLPVAFSLSRAIPPV